MGLAAELRHYYDVIRKRAWVIAVVVILAVGGTALRLANRPSEFRAKVSVLVTPRVIAPTALDDTSPNAPTPYFQLPSAYDETIVNNTVQLLKSRDLLQRVATRVGLTVAEIQERVKTREIFGTHMLVISATDENPARAAAMANTMAQEFSNYYTDLNRAEATRARAFVEEQLTLAQGRLAAAEGALLTFRTRGAVSPSEEISRTVQRLLDLQAIYETARLEETVAQTRLAEIQSQLGQATGQLASLSIATNPIIIQIRDHLTGLELELAKLRQTYTEEHPKIQIIRGQIISDRQRLQAEAAKVLTDQSLGSSPVREQLVRDMVNAEVDTAAARAKAAGITPLMGALQAKLKNRASDETTLGQLQREAKLSEQLFTRLSALHQEAVIRQSKAGTSGQAAIVIVDQATVPGEPLPSPLPKTAAVAGLLGLFVGVALAMLAESLDDRVRSSPQAEAAYGLPVLATIPVMSARSYQRLTTAPSLATLLLPILVVCLVLGAVAGAYAVRADARLSRVIPVGQRLIHAGDTVRK